MSQIPNSTLGRYQIIREIARSNDIVYEAYDPGMNRRVALKELAMPGGATGQQKEDRVKRFMREAKAAGSLSHPNIVTIYEVGQEGERYFIAMEFLDGHTLRNEIDTKGFLEPNRAMEVAQAVLEALDFAHSKGVIHRDIKPDNIQLLSDGRIKLTDFGIARLMFEPNLTIDGQIFGTPSYMSPEQVVGKDIDARNDLFSVGSVLYEMLTGQKAFPGDSVVSITYAIMNHRPSKLPQISDPLWDVLQRALEKAPAARFSDARKMIDAIRAARQEMEQPSIPKSPWNPTGQPQVNPYTVYPGSAGQVINPNAPPAQYAFDPYTAPPPQHGPVAGGPPPFQPYGSQQQQPSQVPYGTQQPYGAVPPAHHAQASLTPYGTANPYASNQGPAQSLQNYFPPGYIKPPTKPLFTDDQRRFMTRLFAGFIAMGALFFVVYLVINGVSGAVRQNTARGADESLIRQIATGSKGLSLNDRIARLEAAIPRLGSVEGQLQGRRQLAVLYEQLGNSQMSSNNFEAASRSLTRSAELDPDLAAYPSDLGLLYGKMALLAPSFSQRAALWQQSIDQWKLAIRLEPDPQVKSRYSELAAEALYRYASDLYNSGDISTAKEFARQAVDLAPKNSEVANLALKLYGSLGGLP